jgi:hypothetical protein
MDIPRQLLVIFNDEHLHLFKISFQLPARSRRRRCKITPFQAAIFGNDFEGTLKGRKICFN